MRLTVKAIVIIILAIIVAAVAIMYAFGVFSQSGEQAGSYWEFSFNITKGTTERAGDQPPTVSSCNNVGEKCFGSNSNCCGDLVCRPEYAGGDLKCLPCGDGDLIAGTGDFCERNDDCCSGKTCHNVGSNNAYCA